ncbi:unnamed protein product [Malus baccata var. baccata]
MTSLPSEATCSSSSVSISLVFKLTDYQRKPTHPPTSLLYSPFSDQTSSSHRLCNLPRFHGQLFSFCFLSLPFAVCEAETTYKAQKQQRVKNWRIVSDGKIPLKARQSNLGSLNHCHPRAFPRCCKETIHKLVRTRERQRYREHYDCEAAAAGAITPITIPETSPYPRIAACFPFPNYGCFLNRCGGFSWYYIAAFGLGATIFRRKHDGDIIDYVLRFS